ncbi:MAG TPA: low molecular weight phosphatase family protein [Candidatus Yaniella excrementigallinarum]|nr:low molecular weight phosphatase family protein [Candidatus Yaniella excrementigallinarum]
MTFHILTVCTGNLCRSPLAAGLFNTGLDPARFTSTSVGTFALVGDTMPEQAQMVAVRMGYMTAADHRATALTKAAVSQADLILGMELNHRRAAAQLQPTAVRRAFTLLEFAHIVGHIQDAQLAGIRNGNDNPAVGAAQIVMRMRGVVPRLGAERLYEVEDPYGRSTQVYERSFKQVQQAVSDIGDYFSRAARVMQP